MVFDEGKGLSTQAQQYDPTPIINELRQYIDPWRKLRDPSDWHVTPETARLLQHWRHHPFSSIRPFFCQVEAVEVGHLADGSRTGAGGGQEVPDSPRQREQRCQSGLGAPGAEAGDRGRQRLP